MKKLLVLLFLTLTSWAPPPATAHPIPTKQIEPSPPTIVLPVNMPTIYKSDETDAQQYGMRMVNEQCQMQSPVFWCKGQQDYEAIQKARPIDAYAIAHVTRDSHKQFKYKDDVVDSWRVHSWEVNNHMAWEGDCDDLASTTLDELVRAGTPLDHIWFLLVSTENTNSLDHLIGMTEDKDGHFWIVGDTFFPSLYPVSEIKHRVLTVARGDNMGLWISPENLGVFDPMTMVRVIADKVKKAPKVVPQEAFDIKHPLVPVKRH